MKIENCSTCAHGCMSKFFKGYWCRRDFRRVPWARAKKGCPLWKYKYIKVVR